MITGRVSREKDYRKPGRETRFFCNESVETRREREREVEHNERKGKD